MDSMTIDDVRSTIADLKGVEPKSFGNDAQAAEAAQWIDIARKAEADVETLLGPAIKEAFAAHKKLTGEKKTILEKLSAAKDRVRVNLANWIAGGHDVKGCYIQRKFRITVTDQCLLSSEFLMTVPDVDGLQKWVDQTEGKIAIPGVTIEPINILYAREVE